MQLLQPLINASKSVPDLKNNYLYSKVNLIFILLDMEMRFFLNETKKYILLFPLCVLIGSVIINILNVDKIDEWNLFTPEYINQVLNLKPEFMDVLKYVAGKRVKHFLVVFLICFSTIRDKLLLVLVGWLGFTFGILLGALYIQYGFNSIWFYLVFVVGHMLIYAFATGLMLFLCNRNQKNLLSGGYMACLALVLMGILLESLINWWVFPKLMSFLFLET